MFAHRLALFRDRPALVLADGRAIGYAQLARAADDVFLAREAPRSRTLVAVECDNRLDTVAGYLGALRRGMPALIVDAALDIVARERLYTQFGVSHAWTKEGRWVRYAAGQARLHPELALLLSTSGSTGAPKLVRLAARNLEANARSIAQYLALNCEELPITSLPLHYSYGLSVLNSHLQVGAGLVLTALSVAERGFWDLMRERAVTSFAGVPTQYAMLERLRIERMDLPHLRTFTQAGGRLEVELARWFGELAALRGQRFWVMYGQTEATPRISYVPPERLLAKLGSIGIAIPGGRLELVDTDGRTLEGAGQTGEIHYLGPNVMMGYAESAEDLAQPDTCGGRLATGDLGWRDEEGFHFITGRLKRIVKVFGNRIGLDEVEGQLRAEGWDAAVTGRDDLLVIALRGASPAAADALAAKLANRWRLHHSGLKVFGVGEWPLSPAGKVLYAELLASIAP